jgi:hypothetical protein
MIDRRAPGGNRQPDEIVAWNKATIAVVDDGVRTEDWGLYIDFALPF